MFQNGGAAGLPVVDVCLEKMLTFFNPNQTWTNMLQLIHHHLIKRVRCTVHTFLIFFISVAT